MDIKQTLKDTAKSAKFGGVSVHLNATQDSRLEAVVELRGSVDLPGDLDKIVANIGGMLGLGNSQESSQPSAP